MTKKRRTDIELREYKITREKNKQLRKYAPNPFASLNEHGIVGKATNNIRALQLDNNIKQSSELSKPFGNTCRLALDIEMETGTGKTYQFNKRQSRAFE